MTPSEKAALEELNLTPEQLAAKQQEVRGKFGITGPELLGPNPDPDLLRRAQGKAPMTFADDRIYDQKCPDCGLKIVRRGNNRLSNCGHMRMSGGGWVPRDQKPAEPKPAPQPEGALSREQGEHILTLKAKLLSAHCDAIRHREAFHDAESQANALEADLDSFIDSLTRP